MATNHLPLKPVKSFSASSEWSNPTHLLTAIMPRLPHSVMVLVSTMAATKKQQFSPQIHFLPRCIIAKMVKSTVQYNKSATAKFSTKMVEVQPRCKLNLREFYESHMAMVHFETYLFLLAA